MVNTMEMVIQIYIAILLKTPCFICDLMLRNTFPIICTKITNMTKLKGTHLYLC